MTYLRHDGRRQTLHVQPVPVEALEPSEEKTNTVTYVVTRMDRIWSAIYETSQAWIHIERAYKGEILDGRQDLFAKVKGDWKIRRTSLLVRVILNSFEKHNFFS